MGLAVAWYLVVLAAAPQVAPQVASRDEPSALSAQPKGWLDILPGPGLKGWTRVAPISSRGVKSVWTPSWRCGSPIARPGSWSAAATCRWKPRPAANRAATRCSATSRSWATSSFTSSGGSRIRRRPAGTPGCTPGSTRRRTSGTRRRWAPARPPPGSPTPRTPAARSGASRTTAPSPGSSRPGQWNVYELTGRGDTLTLWVNGAVVSRLSGLKVQRGRVGLEAELHHIEFRNLKLKRL